MLAGEGNKKSYKENIITLLSAVLGGVMTMTAQYCVDHRKYHHERIAYAIIEVPKGLDILEVCEFESIAKARRLAQTIDVYQEKISIESLSNELDSFKNEIRKCKTELYRLEMIASRSKISKVLQILSDMHIQIETIKSSVATMLNVKSFDEGSAQVYLDNTLVRVHSIWLGYSSTIKKEFKESDY